MKRILLSISLSLATSLFAQETKKLDAAALKNIEAAPVITKPQFVPKSANGPLREVSRTYTDKGARVITMSDGDKIESPLVDVPIHFLRDKAVLADAQSRANLEILARKLKELEAGGARFCIEGHASADGDAAHNQTLSEERATATGQELLARGVSAKTILKTIGLGSTHATHSAYASEALLQEDRRVLVVREK